MAHITNVLLGNKEEVIITRMNNTSWNSKRKSSPTRTCSLDLYLPIFLDKTENRKASSKFFLHETENHKVSGN
jgi:hypothetical protein